MQEKRRESLKCMPQGMLTLWPNDIGVDRSVSRWYIRGSNHYGGVAEWFKAAVLKTVVRKYRGFESYLLRQEILIFLFGEMTE